MPRQRASTRQRPITETAKEHEQEHYKANANTTHTTMAEFQGARESEHDSLLLAELYGPACAPLYWALCRAYGTAFALDLAKTCLATDGDVPLCQSFGYWARYHLQPTNSGWALSEPAPMAVPIPVPANGGFYNHQLPIPAHLPHATAFIDAAATHAPYAGAGDGCCDQTVSRPACRFCDHAKANGKNEDDDEQKQRPELMYSCYWTQQSPRRTPEAHQTESGETAPTAVAWDRHNYQANPEPEPVEASAATPVESTWSNVVRGSANKTGFDKAPTILKRPKKPSEDAALFASAAPAPTPIQVSVSEERLVAIVQAAPKPVLVCEPSQAAVAGVHGLLGMPLPEGVLVTTVARAAVKTAIQGAAKYKSVLIHVSPQLLECGLVQRLVDVVSANTDVPVAIVGYCRAAVPPEGVLDVTTPDGGLWQAPSTSTIQTPTKRAVPIVFTQRPVVDLQSVEALDFVSNAVSGCVSPAGRRVPGSLLVLAASSDQSDAVALRRAFRRNNGLVSRVDIVTYRVHRPTPPAVVAAIRNASGRQSDHQSVMVVPVGVDAHWGTRLLPSSYTRASSATTVIDTGTLAIFDARSRELRRFGRASPAELAARASLVGANGTLLVTNPDAPLDPQAQAGPPTAWDFMHGLAPPGSLLAEALRLVRLADESSPAVPLLRSWNLITDRAAFDPAELYARDDTTCVRGSWADDEPDIDLAKAEPVTRARMVVNRNALLDWCVVSAEFVDDRIALLALVGVRFALRRSGAGSAFDAVFDEWTAALGVLNELASAQHPGTTRRQTVSVRARAKVLGLKEDETFDDLSFLTTAVARLADVDPGSLDTGATSKRATVWCQTVGLQGQATQQLREGARLTQDTLRMATRALRSIGSAVYTAKWGEYPLDKFLPEAEEAAPTGATETMTALRIATIKVGPRCVRARRPSWACECLLCTAPGTQPAPAFLEAPIQPRPAATIVPVRTSKCAFRDAQTQGFVVHAAVAL